MLIDWFTVVAQIINFLVLILLLRRFLYRPIIRVMSEREASIAAQVAEADALKQMAIDEAETYRQQREEFQKRTEELLFETKAEAETWRKDFTSNARKEIDEARASWYKSIEAEKHEFIREVRQRIGRQVCTISRRALTDLADTQLEQRIIEVFIRRIQLLDEHKRLVLAESARRSGNKIILRSSFALTSVNRQNILTSIQGSILSDVDMEFEVLPDLLCGVEISIQDHKLAWTMDDYLFSLEEDLIEALGEKGEKAYAG